MAAVAGRWFAARAMLGADPAVCRNLTPRFGRISNTKGMAGALAKCWRSHASRSGSPAIEQATATAKMPYSAAPFAHDPEKCARFSDKIMRKIKEIEHDPFRQKRIAL